jgi:RHS repeat-associated protein
LVENVTDSIRLSWNVQKKVDSVRFTNGNPTLYYTYDAQGNRLSKRTNPDFANYYVRDAQGNALATYALKKDSLYLIEQNLYGSSRLGVKNLAILAQIDTQKLEMSDTLRIFEDFVGAKNYELSNHLGNVLATISDKTIFNTDHYNGLVYSAQLYYPFGWKIPTLSYTAKKYRFGFNNQEQDPETGWIHFKYREDDPRVSRFFAVDPITEEYPELTPYQFASNSPIWMRELEGLEGMPSTLEQWQDGISNGTPATADQPGYSASNRQSVFDRLTNRAGCALQAAAGFAVGAGSAALLLSPEPFTKGIAVAGLAYSVDQMATGGKKVWTGEDHKTLFNQGVSQGQQFFGVDEQTANNNANWAEFAVDVFAFSPKSYTNPLLKSSTAGAGVLKPGASIANNNTPGLAGGATENALPFRAKHHLMGGGIPSDAVGGTIIPAQNSPYIVVRKGNKIFHIDQHRVKEYIDNPMKPEGGYRGNKVNFQHNNLPIGSTRKTGEKSGNGHKRTPTPGELEMYNDYFNKNK